MRSGYTRFCSKQLNFSAYIMYFFDKLMYGTGKYYYFAIYYFVLPVIRWFWSGILALHFLLGKSRINLSVQLKNFSKPYFNFLNSICWGFVRYENIVNIRIKLNKETWFLNCWQIKVIGDYNRIISFSFALGKKNTISW